jgi:hypothetical protein
LLHLFCGGRYFLSKEKVTNEETNILVSLFCMSCVHQWTIKQMKKKTFEI